MRTYNCLRRAGIRTVEGLLKLDAYRLSLIRNMSSRCIQEVLGKLKAAGYDGSNLEDGGSNEQ